MQLLRDVTKSVARGEVLLADPDAPQSLVTLEPGEVVRGRVAGVVRLDVEECAYLVLEAIDGRVLLIAETSALERRRREGALERNTIVTLTGREALRDDCAVRWIDVHPHGVLRAMTSEPTANSVLDHVALEGAGSDDSAPSPTALRGFARDWQEAIARRVAVLEQAGFLIRDGSGTARRAVGAAAEVRKRMLARDRVPIALAEVSSAFNKRVHDMNHWRGGSIAGTLVAFAQDEQGRGSIVLDAGTTLYALATERRDLTIGARIEGWHTRARDVADASEHDRRRGLAWQLADLSRERDRGCGR
jgi:hypothetical protein